MVFEQFTGSKAADTSHSAEVIFSIGAESREEVDAYIQKQSLLEEVSLESRVKLTVGCTARDLPTWMVTAGICCIWMRAKCRNANMETPVTCLR